MVLDKEAFAFGELSRRFSSFETRRAHSQVELKKSGKAATAGLQDEVYVRQREKKHMTTPTAGSELQSTMTENTHTNLSQARKHSEMRAT